MPLILDKDKREQVEGLDANEAFQEYLCQLKDRFPTNKRITLIHCPTFNFDSFNVEVARNRSYYAYPPTGLQCLKAALSDFDLEIDILDLNYKLLKKICETEDEDYLDLTPMLDEYFNANDVSIIGVSAGVIVSNVFGIKRHPFVQTLNYLTSKGSNLVLAGGIIANNECQNLLRKDLAHFVFDGEAELKLRFFLGQWFDFTGTPCTPGIHFKYENQVLETREERDVVDFKWDVIATYDQVPIESYNEIGCLSPFSRMIGQGRKYGTVQLVRGCRAHCTFCGVTPFMGDQVRHYPVDTVLSEIEFLVKERGVNHIEWLDDDLLVDREIARQLLKELVGRGFGVTWAANNGLIASSLDEELVRLIVKSGCVGFRIGIESGNDQILRQIKKPASTTTLRKASKLLAKFPELFVVGCYIIGFQGERYEQILDTFKFSLEMNLSWSGFSVCQELRDNSVEDEFESDLENENPENYKKITDFVPSKESTDRAINLGKAQYDSIFDLSRDAIPSPEQLNEMWFTFNLFANYIYNKNLRPGGSPSKFIRWVQVIQLGYPCNAVISLFLYLAYLLDGQDINAHGQLEKTQNNLKASGYWVKRFNQYGLDWIMKTPPQDSQGAQRVLQEIQGRCDSMMESV